MKNHLFAVLRSAPARPVRFVGTGSTAGGIQLALLALLSSRGLNELAANGVAFTISAQVNFALSSTVTWRDRECPTPIVHRWALFHCSIASMAVVNMLTFALARTLIPLFAASIAGILVAAAGNYLIGDHFIFRGHRESELSSNVRTSAA